MVAAGLAGIVALALAPDRAEWLLAPAICALVAGAIDAGPLGDALLGNRAAVYWGERSYSIYMLHGVVAIVGGAVTTSTGWVVTCAEASAVLLGSLLAYRWVEVPMRAHLRAALTRP